MGFVHLCGERPKTILRSFLRFPRLDASGQDLRRDQNVVLNRHAGVGFSSRKQAGHDHNRGLQPFRAVNGHDLNGRGGWLSDGLWALITKVANRHHPPVHFRCVMPGILANGLDDGEPCLSELALSVFWVGDKQVGFIENEVKHIVHRPPTDALLKPLQEVLHTFGRGVLNEMWKGRLTVFERNEDLVDVLFCHTDNGRAGEFNRSLPHGRAGHQTQHRHERLDDRLHQQQALPVG